MWEADYYTYPCRKEKKKLYVVGLMQSVMGSNK